MNLVAAYEAARRPPSVSYAENQNRNDPLAKLHEAMCKVMAQHNGSPVQVFASLVRADVEAVEWPKYSAFFVGIPFEQRLALALSMLLRLRSNHTIWTHRLDFTIEPMLRLIVREARRSELVRQLSGLSGVDLAAVASGAQDMCRYGMCMEIGSYLRVGTSSPIVPPDLQDRVQAATDKHVQLGDTELMALVAAPDADAFDAYAHAHISKWLVAIADELRRDPNPPANLEFAEATAQFPPNRPAGDRFLSMLTASLPAQLQEAVSKANEDVASLEAACSSEVTRQFRSPPTWTVALPIENWAVSNSQTATAASAALMTISELEIQWKPDGELAPDPNPRSRTGLSKATICLVVPGICAPDEQLAVREAQSRLDATLCGIWFLDAQRYLAQLGTESFVRREADGRVSGVGIERTRLFPVRSVRAEEMSTIAAIASELTTRWNEPGQRDMWRRVSEGMGFLRSAFAATLFYERYLFLWMALEALLNNLSVDEEEKYARAAPIGTRVGYRASLLLVPEPALAGRTYGEARWVTTLELGALYHLRNKAVHEGRRNPPIDEVMLERFQRRVIAVFETVSHNAFRYGMRRIEELLAWCEHKFPEADLIP